MGRHDDTVQLLRKIVEFPGGETYHGLRLNSRYDGLRDHPGFQALAATPAPAWPAWPPPVPHRGRAAPPEHGEQKFP